MAYISGTITNADPGPTFYTDLAAALTTAGFTLVDTVTISTRTHRVWRSAAANNTQNLDWYLDVAYTTTGAGSLWLTPFEYYDPATDLGYRGPVANVTSTTIETTYYSRYGATGSALETNWVGAGQTTILLTLTTGAFGYWFSVTGNRVIGCISNDATRLLYSGMYTPDPLYSAKAGAALFPLMVARLTPTNVQSNLAFTSTTANSSSMAMTRLPPLASLPTNGWGASAQVYANTPHLTYTSPPTPTVSDIYSPAAFEVSLLPNTTTQTGRFGTLTDVAIMGSSAGIVRGDTVAVSGATWTLNSNNSGAALLFRQV